ncbi:MAG TPA: tRNA pseudouridine(13) synthase TruD [Candidatus Nanoarchaeia archaeon]|nr:tRNA pseudouridine(13) synthase TruD [Candidatus Nanoarchaeia archaeon]
MYKIKQLPEDFIVNEISSIKAENGFYSYYSMKKRNFTTVGALEFLSRKLGIPLKNFGFAGNKDKNAVTEQKISIFKGGKNLENEKFNGIGLKYLGSGKNPISLGDLEGNNFIITIRNLDESEIKKIKGFENKKITVPNIFGQQRFSRNNSDVGKSIIKKDFKKAVGLIMENKGDVEAEMKMFLESNKNNYVGALKLIPLKTRKLFVHAYQSFLFNKITDEFIKLNPKADAKLPVIGFDFEIEKIKDKKLKKIIENIVENEKITTRDFIISQMPELTSEGTERDLFFTIKYLKIIEAADDGLNTGMKKIKIEFALPKSCYATVALDFLMQP